MITAVRSRIPESDASGNGPSWRPSRAFQSTSTEKAENGKTASLSRFCFDDVLGRRGQAAMDQASPGRLHYIMAKYVDPGALQALSPKYGSPWPKTDSETATVDTLKFHVGPLQFDILPRSAYGIYQFLGKLLRQSRGGLELDPSQVPENIREDELRPGLSTVKEDRQLLNLVLNQSASGCFAETRFIDGYYCVPEEGSANTKRVFGLRAQLLALQTSASDLAITPTVHIRSIRSGPPKRVAAGQRHPIGDMLRLGKKMMAA
jgi:hypothetical protein